MQVATLFVASLKTELQPNIADHSGRQSEWLRLHYVAFRQYQDLFDRDDNTEVQNKIAGRSVACLDRTGCCPFGLPGSLVPSCTQVRMALCARLGPVQLRFLSHVMLHAVHAPGSGSYGVAAANYGGPVKLFETYPGSNTRLREVATQAGIVGTTGGRGAPAQYSSLSMTVLRLECR
jgi:hypothetical protein